VLIAVFLVACAAGDETEPTETTETAPRLYSSSPPPPEIAVTLDGYMGAENVGLLVAEEKGYYDDLGLNVSLRSPIEPRRPVTYVADRTDEIGVAQMPQVVLAKEKGAPLVVVGSVIPRPTAAVIWLPESGIQSIADLRGKTIATPGIPYQEAFLETVLEREGLTLKDVKIKHARFDLVPALLHGKADAIFGGSWNLEGAALESLGAEPVITRLSSLGIPAYEELVVLVRTDTLAKEPEMVRDFMSATVRGTRFAVGHPNAAVKALKEGIEHNLKSTPKEFEAQLKATLPLLSKSGRMDPAQTTGLVNWMQKQGMIGQKVPTSDLLTNEYLPHP
jgi:ABC-type nitrate/sulfonate/bicarbonate transport system substrate-binding protein